MANKAGRTKRIFFGSLSLRAATQAEPPESFVKPDLYSRTINVGGRCMLFSLCSSSWVRKHSGCKVVASTSTVAPDARAAVPALAPCQMDRGRSLRGFLGASFHRNLFGDESSLLGSHWGLVQGSLEGMGQPGHHAKFSKTKHTTHGPCHSGPRKDEQ